MFWGGSGREQVICGGVSVTMQSLISFCGLLGIQLSPARCHRRIALAALEVSPPGMIKHHRQCYGSLQSCERSCDLHSKVQA